MKSIIKKCPECRSYTLESTCKKCGTQTVSTLPPRFSPEDRFAKYRIKVLYGKDR
ncbi:MAG: RNA-protein complex protein Nop10 [Candidatus Thermoplasmatota archaeon]|nr:RNA-protein complex protein Nop10 [Candidatus Thermoplasmatota archaeon]MCL5680845.1 RNA-protein complex protein Nop10 [Candidatus Thermoplasmatota archaeon]